MKVPIKNHELNHPGALNIPPMEEFGIAIACEGNMQNFTHDDFNAQMKDVLFDNSLDMKNSLAAHFSFRRSRSSQKSTSLESQLRGRAWNLEPQNMDIFWGPK